MMLMDKNLILKYALQNAIKFKGQANKGAIIGKLLSEKPKLKTQIKDLANEVDGVIKEISKLDVKEQRKKLEKMAPELLKKKKVEKKRELPELPNAKKVMMRFEPSPSGALHIGHGYVLSLNSAYQKKYNGKLMLRIGDTNPDNIYEPAYKLIEEDANWLTNNGISEVVVQSSRLNIYYNYMERLFEKNKAYVCKCVVEDFRKMNNKGEACPCRGLAKNEHIKRWKKMFTEYQEGDAVVRLKTDLKNNNPAMRDFPLFRICDSEHPKQGKKFRVWPLMNMAVAIDDIEFGMTHVIRAKDHVDNAKRQKIIFDYLNKPFHEALFVGRINFKGVNLSSSDISKNVKEGRYSGWDDIQLPSLSALRRRGFQREALIKYAIDVGMSLSDKTVTKEDFFKSINAFNKEVIDSKSNRYFFIWNPVEVKVIDAPEQRFELDLHPDKKKGGRKFNTTNKFYITREDFNVIHDKRLYRLMDCLNFKKVNNKLVFDSLDYATFKEKGVKIMHWLPKEELIDVEVLTQEGAVFKGYGENNMDNLKRGDIVQLERFGFCRLDKKDKNKLVFWFAHR